MTLGEHTFSLNNKNIHYYEDGLHHGRTILLLHGGIGDAELNWKDIIPPLAEDYHVLAPDLPGFGGSDALSGSASLSHVLDWILGFLSSQDVEQAVVVGNSFGGLIARLLAAKHPHIIPAVVVINGGYVPQVPPFAKILLRLPLIGSIISKNLAKLATSEESLREMIHHEDIITPAFIDCVQANRDGFARLMQMTAARPLPTPDKPMVSSMILWGNEDQSVAPSEGKKLQSVLAGASFVDIEDCGHLLQLEEPDVFEYQIKNFLAKHDPVKKSSIPGE